MSSRRGSVFLRCLRANTDPRFARYPTLPVDRCIGYEESRPRGESAGDGAER